MKIALSLALLALLVVAAPAPAATVTADSTSVTISAPNRERNRITVTRRASGGVTVRDSRTPISAGPGCTQTRPDRASCGTSATTDVIADLGPLSDTITIGSSAPVRATLRGGSGNDTLHGGSRNDLLDGGTGRDTVSYSGRRENVTVTLAGGADDGAAGEGDDVVAIERAIGGNGFDTLVGTDGGNALYGGPGDDRLDGAGGVDFLYGGRGNDLLQGGAGDDSFVADPQPDGSDAMQGGEGRDLADYGRRLPTSNLVVDPDGFADDGERPGPTLTFEGAMPTFLLLSSPERDNVLPDVESVRGGAGADVLRPSDSGGTVQGGPGTDVVYGGPGPDSLSGDAGFDRIVSRDGRADSVRCGTEVDRVWLDLGDQADVDCEQRLTTFKPVVAPVGRRLEDGGLRVRVECPPQAFGSCNGTLRAETVRRVSARKRARLGSATYGLVPGDAKEVVIPFGEDGQAVVGRLAPLRVQVTIKGRDKAGVLRPGTTRLVLRP